MSYTQVLRDTGTNLTKTFYSDEAPVDATGDVTVTITRADGSTLIAGAATTHGTTGVYSYPLEDQADLDYLKVVWTGVFGSLTQTATDYVEIVGGFYFTLAELRASDPALADPAKFPAAKLAEARLNVETEFERICTGWAFVPRFNRVTVNGNNDTWLLLPHLHVRAVRSLSVGGTAYSAPELADLTVSEAGELTRATLGRFTLGSRNVIVAYEHGLDVCPPDVKRVAMIRAKELLMQPKSGISPRAETFSVVDGGSYRLSTGGVDRTGNYEVDNVLSRYGGIIAVA